MTDPEPAKEAIDESAERQEPIIEQITALFQQLSPGAQADVLEILAEDENLDEDDDE